MKQKMLSVLLLALLFCSAGCSVKSKEEYRAELLEGDFTATIEIHCDTILSHMDELKETIPSLIPENGVLLGKTEVGLPENATVYDLLQKAARAEGMAINSVGAGPTAYIASIRGIGEYDCGALSGWIFYVNGVRPGESCGSYRLKAGDEVGFYYTCALGEDLDDMLAE